VTDGFRTIEPKILYFGTPVALISSLNEDGSTNLAPHLFFLGTGVDRDARTAG
jgi:flavin reductase (DIM6/NTAB) family NADH-FMN oxidoreductase RutF